MASAVLMLAFVSVGCDHGDIYVEETTKPYIHKVDEFLPLNGNQTEADYWSDGTKTNYKLKTETDGTKVSFKALSHETVVDEEAYEVRDGSVFLARAVGEDFDEPMPLLKFPLRIGDKYDWNGKLVCSETKLVGAAQIQTSSDYVNSKGKSREAVKVEVNLDIKGYGWRKLSFWFVKGMGVLKTEMGKNVREPQE